MGQQLERLCDDYLGFGYVLDQFRYPIIGGHRYTSHNRVLAQDCFWPWGQASAV